MNLLKTVHFYSVTGVLILLSFSLQAQETSVESLLRCDEINDTTERLKCFDTLVEMLKQSQQQALKPATPSDDNEAIAKLDPPPPPPATPEELFGDPPEPKEPRPGEPKELTEITSGLKNFWLNNDKDYVIVLENGQIWQTLDGSTLRFPANPVDVRIKKNFFGSYVMEIRNATRAARSGKVRRIR